MDDRYYDKTKEETREAVKEGSGKKAASRALPAQMLALQPCLDVQGESGPVCLARL